MNGPTIHRTSPQIAQPATISSTMLDVIIALIPALAMAVFLFGVRVLALTAVSVGTCVLAEYGYRRLRGQSNTIGDLSACVTGLLLAMSLPVTAPYWAPVLGGLFAIVIVKQFYGGLGRNFLNPALAGRTLLCTFPGLMTSWVDAFQRPGLIQGVDAASSATPMGCCWASTAAPWAASPCSCCCWADCIWSPGGSSPPGFRWPIWGRWPCLPSCSPVGTRGRWPG